jgi:metallo-beta-lactamase class B
VHAQSWILETPNLKIQQLTEQVYLHVTYLQTDSFGKVACNGMIYMNETEAIVFDTPSDNASSIELIQWIQGQGRNINAVVVNHFHIDALGGLDAFHELGIPSYGSDKTKALAETVKPQNGFETISQIELGDKLVINQYFGEAHTTDNIVSYLPAEGVLFGGCMIKSLNAGKGNLEDANVDEWSETVRKIKKTFPDIKMVIPGHGKHGDSSLLDYTIAMFETK